RKAVNSSAEVRIFIFTFWNCIPCCIELIESQTEKATVTLHRCPLNSWNHGGLTGGSPQTILHALHFSMCSIEPRWPNDGHAAGGNPEGLPSINHEGGDKSYLLAERAARQYVVFRLLRDRELAPRRVALIDVAHPDGTRVEPVDGHPPEQDEEVDAWIELRG